MAIELDDHPKFKDFAHPEKFVSAAWLSARLGKPGLRVVESDEDAYLYDIGHIPGCLLYTSPSPRDLSTSRMPSSA